jgi:hypothetical protein
MSTLVLPRGLSNRIAEEARAAGERVVETGGFLLSKTGAPVSVLALTGERDIQREWGLFHVGSRAMATLFDWASDHTLMVPGQWHSHRYEALLSETDLAYGFNVPGFRSCIVPDYEHPPADPRDWGWWLFDDQQWTETPAPSVEDGAFSVITFEAGYVREH